MYNLILRVIACTVVLLPIALVTWIVQIIRKKDTRGIKRGFCLVLAVFVVSTATGIALTCDHEWVGATCSAPKTCSLCGETEGEPLRHIWMEATCSKPKHCSTCGLTDGTTLEHNWTAATCERAKHCLVCGFEEGTALEHITGDWRTSSVDYVNATVTSKKQCTVCQQYVETQTVGLQTLIYGDKLMISPRDFVKRLDNILNRIAECNIDAVSGNVGTDYACGLKVGDEKVGLIMFSDGEETIKTSQKDDTCIQSVLGTAEDSDNYTKVFVALIVTCDPTLNLDEAIDIAVEATVYGEASFNGLIYSIVSVDNGAILSVAVEE